MIHSLKYTGNELDKLLDDSAVAKTKSDKAYEIFNDGFKVDVEYKGSTKTILSHNKEGLIVASRTNGNKLPILKVVDQENLSSPTLDLYYDKIEGTIKPSITIEPNKLILPGNPGAGVGLATDESLIALGLKKMEGSENPHSENFGNYIHTATGSIMVYIPKHYVKITNDTNEPYRGLRVDISNEEQPDYWLPRVFINNNKIHEGIFIDKYTNTYSLDYGVNGSVPVSKKGKVPITSNAMTYLRNPNGSGNNTLNDISAAIEISKLRGSNYFVEHWASRSMLNYIADACWQAAYRAAFIDLTIEKPEDICAWANMEPYRPRGNGNNGIDLHDELVRYTPDKIVSGRCLVASCEDSQFAKITHNGQRCGITDISGNMWSFCHGYYHTYVTKESTDIVTLTRNDCLAANVPSNGKFVKLNATTYTSGNRWLGNGTTMPFDNETNRQSNGYLLNALGIPNSNAVTSGSHKRYGCTVYYNQDTSNSNLLYGADWDDSDGGPRNCGCNAYFSDSDTDVGFRLAAYSSEASSINS